jgi:hypothetical protein
MSKEKLTYWCEWCSKKYYFDISDELLEIQRSTLQKKIPHIEPETSKKTNPEYFERKSFKKCKICGYLLKELKDEK